MPKLADFKTDAKSWWCAGCGDFGVLAALQRALVNLGKNPHEVALVAGIGCSGKIGNYINCYNFHVVHGRTLPTAMGIKLANRDLTVLAAGGDGDAYAIGMGHFLHAVRRNPDITYIVMDNHVYGLTKGQTSPTSDRGFKSKSQAVPNADRPVRPLQLAIAAGATFVAQGFSGDVKQLASLIERGIEHRGFALINCISPCVTFNKVNTYDFYRESLVQVDEIPGYDRTDRAKALKALIDHDDLVTGLIFESDEAPFEEGLSGFPAEPIAASNLAVPVVELERIAARMR